MANNRKGIYVAKHLQTAWTGLLTLDPSPRMDAGSSVLHSNNRHYMNGLNIIDASTFVFKSLLLLALTA
jgi:hypothetical protein